jgi:hypothetical protein
MEEITTGLGEQINDHLYYQWSVTRDKKAVTVSVFNGTTIIMDNRGPPTTDPCIWIGRGISIIMTFILANFLCFGIYHLMESAGLFAWIYWIVVFQIIVMITGGVCFKGAHSRSWPKTASSCIPFHHSSKQSGDHNAFSPPITRQTPVGFMGIPEPL